MITKNKKISIDDIDDARVLTEKLMTFVAVCLPHYMTLPSAPLHFELSEILEKDTFPLLEVIGFRGSAKTTFASLAYPLYCALTAKYKFIVIINDTSEQVKGNLHNIKTELENNQFIKKLYPSVKMGHTWSDFNLLLSNGVRIIGRSRGQNIRGIRHREHRPDLIIVDDPENTLQVKKKENRDATESWFNSEIVPAQQETNSKLIVIGNLLHNDGFMARLAKNPLFKVLRYPFFGENGKVAWKGKYPTEKDVQTQRTKVGETAWAREYLLKIISEEDQVIKETDIQKYPVKILSERDDAGNLKLKIRDGGVGVDLAISLKDSADYTAMVCGLKVEWNGEKILVKPHPVELRLDFDNTQKRAIQIRNEMPMGSKFYVEDIGYQKAALQGMSKAGLSVFPMRPISDKRARLETISPYVKNGTVLFPEQGCENLIQQIINFGIEQHDDLVDAFVYMVLGLMNKQKTMAVARPDRI